MKQFTAFLLSWCFFSLAYAQDKTVAGDWEGKFGGQIRLIFHLVAGTGANLTGTLDSPDQGAKGLPFASVIVVNDSIHITMTTPEARYDGRIVTDSTINGSWRQGAAILPLLIKKGNSFVEPKRPQTPLPPFSYRSEDVEYDNADKTVHFGATYTCPNTGGPFATAILITGSGSQDRDETLAGHKPFAVIADHLTKNGYAVLRIDDRGVGKTKGPMANVTSADFAKDIEAALTYLKTRKESNPRKIGLIGHSEGGLIAFMAAAANPEAIQFIVTLAGPGTPGTTLLADQNEAIWLKHNATPAAATAYRSLFSQIVAPITMQSDSVGIYKNAWQSYLNWKKVQPAAITTALGLADDAQSDQLIKSMIPTLNSHWAKFFLTTDPAVYIRQLKCKLLAINGSEDIQVLARTNLPAIQQAVEQSGIKVYNSKELNGLNHLFQHCKSCTAQEYFQLEETFAPEALDTITTWLNEQVK